MYYFNENRKLWLSFFISIFLISLQAVVAFGQESKEVQIFEVRKKLQMSANDPIVRDYYVNAGQAVGLKHGAMVNVFRKAPLADPYKQETQSHVELPVGVMKVIYSDRTMSIGRIHNIRSSKDSPILDGDVFMVGDRIDLGTLSFDKSGDAKGESETKAAGALPNKETQGEAPSLETPAEVSQKPQEKIEVPTQLDKKAPTPSRTSASLEPARAKENAKNEVKSAKSLTPESKTLEILAR